MNRSSIASVALVVVGGVLRGQEPSRAPAFIPHVGLSGAVDYRNGPTRYQPMYLGVASLEWTTRIRRVSLRVDGVYAARQKEELTFADGCGECTLAQGVDRYFEYSLKVSAKGAFVGATYDLTRGAFRPYVLGGVGAVETRDRRIRVALTVCETCDATTRFSNGTPISGAAQVGFGAAYSWRWISLVGEAKYFAVTNGIARGLNGALPVSLGLRF